MAERVNLESSVDALPDTETKKKKGGKKGDKKGLVDQLMENPDVMDALKSQFGAALKDMPNYGEFAESLPAACKKRVKALKNIQVEYQKVDARFHAELHKLECQFAAQYQPLYVKRQQIVSGEYEPTDAECEFTLYDDADEEEEEEEGDSAAAAKPKAVKEVAGDSNSDPDGPLAVQLEEKAKIEDSPSDEPKSEYDENTKGIPEFWLTCLKNVEEVAHLIEEVDEPVLKHLENLTMKLTEDPMGFVLEFHFSDNPFFTNKVLTKTYQMKVEVDETDPFSFDGSEIFKAEGCTINWNKGKNITVKTIKKKQRNRNKTQTRVITKQVPTDSFFKFFSPPALPDDEDDDVEEDVASTLARDYDIGLFIKENLIPKAVLYFTGEALDNDDDDEEYDEEDEDGEDEDEEDPDYKPAAGGDPPPECKQQ